MWEVVCRHRLLLALCLAASLAAGVLVYAWLPPVYQSTAQVLVWQKRPDAMLSVDSRHGSGEDSLATQQELLKSTAILDRAIREHGLAELPSLQAEKEATAEILRKKLTVSRGKSSGGINNVLHVFYRGAVADECGVILAAVLDSYKKFFDNKFQTFAGDTLELVLRERADLEKDLTRKEAAYQAFLEKSPLLIKKPDSPDLQRNRLASIQTRRSALLLRRLELRSQLDRIETALQEKCDRETILTLIAEFARGTEEPEVGKTTTAAMPDQLTTLLLEEQKLLERYGADHPEVRSVRKRIAIARRILVVPATAWDDPVGEGAGRAVGDPVQRHLRILRQKLQHVADREERLRRLFDDEHEEARKLARYEIQDESFRTSITLTRQSYEALNKRLQDAHLMKNGGGYDVEIVSPPSEGRKVAPSLALILPIAAMLGLLMSLGLIYLREATSRRLRSPEEVRRLVGLPVLGCIPSFSADAKRPARLGSSLVDPRLPSRHSPRSAEAEAYRSLRNALVFQTREPPRKVLQITSPGCGDGKSTLAANLAIALAQGGKKVILVEADLHRPRLAELFRLTPASGLSQVLAGERELQSAIEDSGLPGLAVLFAGPLPLHSIDLLTSHRFQELLERLRDAYDFVLVDTPALMAATEAAAVAARADGVLLAVNLTRNSRGSLEHSLEVLETVGADVLGVVVNGVSAGPASFGRRRSFQEERGGMEAKTVSNGSA